MFSQIRLELTPSSPSCKQWTRNPIAPKLAKDHLVNWVGATHLLSPWTSGWNDYSLEFWIEAGPLELIKRDYVEHSLLVCST
jgi:hypothetical protein